jgi:hypothetical protein
VVCVAALAVLTAACARTPAPDQSAWFIDATAASGLSFIHHNGRTGRFYAPEVIAPGVALFDSDGDGDLDVYLIQSEDGQGRFFRNDLQVMADGTRRLSFTDDTVRSGLGVSGYGWVWPPATSTTTDAWTC